MSIPERIPDHARQPRTIGLTGLPCYNVFINPLWTKRPAFCHSEYLEKGHEHSVYSRFGSARETFRKNTYQRQEIGQISVQSNPMGVKERKKGRNLTHEQLASDQREVLRQQRLVVLGKLVATIAHKIGTPLTAISGHLQLLLEDPNLSADFHQRIHIVFEQTQRLNSVMKDLLNFVRTPTFSLGPVDISQCLEQSRQLFLPILEKQSITLNIQIESSLPLAWADSLQLQEAFNNLIDNAIDAMPDGGKLTVRAWPQSSQRNGVEEPGVAIEIRDSGVGIPEHLLDKIVEPFFTTKDIGEGTGLGLAITSEIIQQHHGKLSMESKPGQGTILLLWLPTWNQKT